MSDKLQVMLPCKHGNWEQCIYASYTINMEGQAVPRCPGGRIVEIDWEEGWRMAGSWINQSIDQKAVTRTEFIQAVAAALGIGDRDRRQGSETRHESTR